ncbi:MAG TPA: hypothetical protein VHJ38_19205 [Nitrososphaeraceae archaeon]|nr:hypothetical protein [Nitrososphaeraceae archaeon]
MKARIISANRLADKFIESLVNPTKSTCRITSLVFDSSKFSNICLESSDERLNSFACKADHVRD